MLSQLFATQFIILALFINMVIFCIFNNIKSIITKGKGVDSDFGLPEIIVRNLILSFVFGFSFISTWFMVQWNYIQIFDDSIFLTSAWSAVLSTITYNIGMKEVLSWVKKFFKNKIINN